MRLISRSRAAGQSSTRPPEIKHDQRLLTVWREVHGQLDSAAMAGQGFARDRLVRLGQ